MQVIIDTYFAAWGAGGRRLIPDKSSTYGQRVCHLAELCDSVEVGLLSYGAALHPDVPAKDVLPWMLRRKMKR